jgi:cytochrome c6
MNRAVRTWLMLGLIVSTACATGFAQAPGEAVYKAKCQMCHGAAGAADTPTAKMLKVKPLSDPEIRKLTADQMFDSIKNGKGKMQPFKDKLTDAQIRDSVAYYRSLK